MTQYGVTEDGFVLKGFTEILQSARQRAIAAFGPDTDLADTSVLTKLLQVTSDEDAMLWQRLEDLYYSQFASTASGSDLDLLGQDIGLERNYLFAEGEVRVTIQGALPGRSYLLPEGTVLLDEQQPPNTFHLTAPVTLTAQAPTVTARARAFEAGPRSNIEPQTLILDPDYLRTQLHFPDSVTFEANNPGRFTGGELFENDTAYRARQLGFPRDMWTLQAVRAAVLRVRGVLDVLLSDTLGGVDVTQSIFHRFKFGERTFSGERKFGEPYFFDVVVAHEFARPWRTTGAVTGIYEQVRAEVDRVRPVGIHPNIIEANHIEIGLRATVVIDPGQDANSLRAALLDRLSRSISTLRLGGDVLYSQVMCALVDQPGVLDVQDLRLRRFPPLLGRITFGAELFQADPIEVGVGENLTLGPTEIAQFRQDSGLIDVRVVAR
ncbi:baseplate J/gp47 family protein [Nocardia transvalensis]|uniref:baseplate J/gp47 family protein n=1 Tax=Nocardia transvalensis TaxID=37333 RepID=UPI00189637AC|nr:baseplate J/gp47 family protein [Nocardia transvalensis]MBF6328319.1 baseplate J/gp47 family protein [Nocardia transvalensis]